MKLGMALRALATVGSSIAAGLITSPDIGIALGTTIVGAGAMRRLLSGVTRVGPVKMPPLQKLGTPVTAALIPILLQSLGLDLQPICDALTWLQHAACADPKAAGAALGMGAVLLNTLGRQAEETVIPPAAKPPAGGA